MASGQRSAESPGASDVNSLAVMPGRIPASGKIVAVDRQPESSGLPWPGYTYLAGDNRPRV
jgi:hypothetical protein